MKKIKEYYVCRNFKSWNFNEIDMACGPYKTIEEAKYIMNKIASEGVLNDSRYEVSFRINIYRSTILDLNPDIIYSEVQFLDICNNI